MLRKEVLGAFRAAKGMNEITIKTIDPVNMHLIALDGTRYVELDDHAIVCADDSEPMPIRYYTTASHGGGLTLKPRSVYLNGEWRSAIDGSIERNLLQPCLCERKDKNVRDHTQ